MSLGAPFGRANDPSAAAATNAAAAGVIVVTSAGNAGPGRTSPVRQGAPDRAPSRGGDGPIDEGGRGRAPSRSREAIRDATRTPPSWRCRAGRGPGARGRPGHDVDESLGCAASDYCCGGAGCIVVTVSNVVCARLDRALLGQAARAAAVMMINNAGFPPYEGNQIGAIPFLGADEDDEAAILAADGLSPALHRIPGLRGQQNVPVSGQLGLDRPPQRRRRPEAGRDRPGRCHHLDRFRQAGMPRTRSVGHVDGGASCRRCGRARPRRHVHAGVPPRSRRRSSIRPIPNLLERAVIVRTSPEAVPAHPGRGRAWWSRPKRSRPRCSRPVAAWAAACRSVSSSRPGWSP